MSWRSAFCVAALLALGARAQEAGDGWERIDPGLELAFPRDHGAHPAYETEWWYLTGNVEDTDGRRLGFQLTFFRSGLVPGPAPEGASPLRARQALAAHLAVTDVAAGRTRHAERLRRASSPLARASETDMDLALDGWTLARREGDVLLASATDAEHGLLLELELRPTKPLVLHGAGGVSAKGGGPGNASAYTSWTRLAVTGRLAAGGAPREVTGSAWFDHEFGTTVLGEGVVGWDWFGLQLDDGRELMLFELRGEDGARRYAGGTLVAADGTARALAAEELRVVPEGRWTSPATGARYPARWTIELEGERLRLAVAPLVADSELVTEASTDVAYWEGPVVVSGDATGRGYAELTGYAGSMSGRF